MFQAAELARLNKVKDLAALFNPKSVAIIGASESPQKVGAIVLKNIVTSGFNGQIYPINPNLQTPGVLRCYPDVGSLPEVPDLAVIAIPAAKVLEVLIQVGEKGIKNAVVFAAGFKEIGADGAALEKQLVEVAQKYNINVLGPNCLGFVNNMVPINVTFGEPVGGKGNLRFISQSGAIAASLFDWCKSTHLSFSEFVTLGNKAVISENDVLEYFQKYPPSLIDKEGISSVCPVGLYLESIVEGAQFLKTCAQMSKTNPIFIIKPGKSKAAAKAMQSHTGAIAGDTAVLEAVLDQAGVIRADTLEDFFDLSRAFAWENAPAGPKVAIISNAGGPAVISADAVISSGLQMAQFNEVTQQQLSKALPRTANIHNPVDVLGDALADRVMEASEIVLATEEVSALVVILTPQIMTEIGKTAQVIAQMSKKYHKPIFCSFIGGNLVAEGEKILNQSKIPSFRFPERAIAAIGAMWRFKNWQMQKPEPVLGDTNYQMDISQAQSIVSSAALNQQPALDNVQASDMLLAAGIHTPATQNVETLDEAKAFALAQGYPVVLKLSAPGLLHKKKIGGIITGIGSVQDLEDGWNKMEHKVTQRDLGLLKKAQIQIQKEIISGIEVIVGVKTDPTFGKVLLFGAGGTYVEQIADRNLHLLPITINGARELIARSKIFPLLHGDGSEPPYALNQLAEVVVRLGQLAAQLPDVSDLEINPVIVTLNGVWAVDGKAILQSGIHNIVSDPKFQVAALIRAEEPAGKFHVLEFQPEKPLQFTPGQYISVKVAPDRINSYSIACHENFNKFSLLVDTTPSGPGSKFFESLKEGEKITYLGPFGQFSLNLSDGSAQMVFLATGSGLAPLRCMIEEALMVQNSKLPIKLYWGLTNTTDIFWTNWLEFLKSKYPNFDYNIVIWKPDSSWTGHTGFITDFLSRDFPNASSISAYLCGNKNMIADATQILTSHGCPKEQIYTEKY